MLKQKNDKLKPANDALHRIGVPLPTLPLVL